eukprot:gnl/TRDRNA2_/TRDRNA2_81466_c1_seq1.p1 gnl/TRDRNA2_/TRDRNA2_81466_c1~~gnl/TRDRNA2_/TRDRNA2_81466_c1_seq1.p1  ORF type:complete len:668 (+),score=132.25 gnl/TRDRNA2_/TRDRNA2_81466_c1_seq1:59-2005(+)
MYAKNRQQESQPGVRKIQVLDKDSRTRLSVMLSRLPVSKVIYERVLRMEHFNKEQVELLLSNAPKPHEIALLENARQEHKIDEFNVWDAAEEFLFTLLSIPDHRLRIQVWHLENSFQERVEEMSTALDDISSGLGCILSSPALRHLLSVILTVGNHLNGGTIRGRADGFSIESLGMLKTVKCTPAAGQLPGQQGTLVDYIVREMDKEYPAQLNELFERGKDMELLKNAARHKPEQLLEELKVLETELTGVLASVQSVTASAGNRDLSLSHFGADLSHISEAAEPPRIAAADAAADAQELQELSESLRRELRPSMPPEPRACGASSTSSQAAEPPPTAPADAQELGESSLPPMPPKPRAFSESSTSSQDLISAPGCPTGKDDAKAGCDGKESSENDDHDAPISTKSTCDTSATSNEQAVLAVDDSKENCDESQVNEGASDGPDENPEDLLQEAKDILAQHGSALAAYSGEVESLATRFGEIEEKYKELCEWFAMGSKSKIPPEEFCAIFRDFLTDMNQARMALEKSKCWKRESTIRNRTVSPGPRLSSLDPSMCQRSRTLSAVRDAVGNLEAAGSTSSPSRARPRTPRGRRPEKTDGACSIKSPSEANCAPKPPRGKCSSRETSPTQRDAQKGYAKPVLRYLARKIGGA